MRMQHDVNTPAGTNDASRNIVLRLPRNHPFGQMLGAHQGTLTHAEGR